MLATFAVALALASTASAGVGRVVVLGDSLASGTNLGPRIPGSYAACGQTIGSYPQLAKLLIQPSSWVDASCNGGHAGVMWNSWWGLDAYVIDPAERVEIPRQFDSLRGDEQAVIVGTGGNEAYFGEVVFACMGHVPDLNTWIATGGAGPFDNNCKQNYVNSSTGYNRLRDKVAGSEELVGLALAEVKRLSPNAKIFLIGTPRIAPANGASCMPNPILTPIDAPIFAVWEDELRLAMQRTATAVGGYFVDMQAIGGSNHSMCAPAANRWMNGWSTENIDYPGLALHNTPAGAKAIAQAIADSMRSAGLDVPAGPTGPTGPSGPVAPDVARINPVANPTKSTTQSISYSGAPGNTFQCKLDGATYAPCSSSPVNLTNLPSGTHIYSVTQSDGATVSPAGTVTWLVDATPPVAPTVTRTDPAANPTKSTDQLVAYSGAEAGGTFQCKLDNLPSDTCPSSPVALTDLGNGTHTYSVTQTDAVGNVGSATAITWTIDTVAAAPSVTRTAPTLNPTTSTAQTISFGGEAGATFECKLDDAAYAACPNSPLTLSDLSLGSHIYSVVQTDALGNIGPAGSVSWTVKSGPPDPTEPTDPPAPPTAKLSPVTPRTIVPGRTGGAFSTKPKFGVASFKVTLSNASTVRMRIERVVSGRAARASTAWTKFKLKSGRTTIRISGRSARRALAAGLYRIHLKVSGASTDVVGKAFRIKR